MIQFILSCLLLLSILLWWAEAQYSFIYRVIMCLKRLCGWIKKQTKLKIDICKWFLPCLLIVGAVYTLYYPYYKQTLEFKEGTFVIKEYPEKLCQRYQLKEEYIKEIMKQEHQPENQNIYEIMQEIGRKRGCIISGGNIDDEKMSKMLLDEFKNGILGQITIEKVTKNK